MESKVEYMDLVYFGYSMGEGAEESRKHQSDFMKEIKERFEDVKLTDAYDEIKGYRQEVYLDPKDRDNYSSWLIGKQWYQMSLNMQLIMMDQTKIDEFKKYIEMAKDQYPESFKSK